jgi:hypothetical protein
MTSTQYFLFICLLKNAVSNTEVGCAVLCDTGRSEFSISSLRYLKCNGSTRFSTELDEK